MANEEWVKLKEKMKKVRLDYVHSSSFKAEKDKSLSTYKFDCGDGVEILDTPIRRLLEDSVYSDAELVQSFNVLYYRYKEMGLDLIGELELK